MIVIFLSDNRWRFRTVSINTLTSKQIFWKKKPWRTFSELKVLQLKKNDFHSKVPRQKLMLRQNERRVQNGPVKSNGVLPLATLFLWKINFSIWTCWLNLPTSQISINILFVSAWVLFECVFSMWVSFIKLLYTKTIFLFKGHFHHVKNLKKCGLNEQCPCPWNHPLRFCRHW